MTTIEREAFFRCVPSLGRTFYFLGVFSENSQDFSHRFFLKYALFFKKLLNYRKKYGIISMSHNRIIFSVRWKLSLVKGVSFFPHIH